MSEKEKKEVETVVVRELPTTPLKEVKGDDGKEYSLITIEEAIKEIRDDVKEIKKHLV